MKRSMVCAPRTVPFAIRGALVSLVALGASSCSGSRTSIASPDPGGPTASAEPASSGAPLERSREGAFATRRHRNLFAEIGKPAADIDAKIADAYQRLFHGSPDQVVRFDAGHNERGPLAFVLDVGNDDVRSEGMSYGMMIAVQCDHQQDFDALWNWSKTHMQVSRDGHPARGYFAWRLRADGTVMDEMPAPDGEEYFAMSLLFAAHRWGSGAGIYDYRREALELLAAMKDRQPLTGVVQGGRRTTVLALFNPEHQMVRFTPDAGNVASNSDHTDPSYHLPAFYELWARWGPPADRAFWLGAATASRDLFVKTAHPITGLTPDYSNFDGTPKAASWDAGTVNFRYDAWRTAMNWSVDSAWWAADPRQTELSNRLLAFFSSQGEAYPSTYTLDGTPTDNDHALGLVATNAVAALAASEPRARHYIEALYSAEPPTGKWRYYNGMLFMLSLLHVSGNFRIHMPSSG
jgi:oligosaccharide reducing-end xylanase